MRPWVLLETNYSHTKERPYEVAVLPLGATEPHNLHLPYGTDVFEAQTIGEHICAEAHRRGAKVVLLPTMPFGTETNLQHFPLALNVNPATLQCVIGDLLASLVNSGIRKVVLLNSHGGNDLKPMLRAWYGQTEAHVFLCNWYQAVRGEAQQIFAHPDDHAGEMETSFALAYFPEFVAKADDGRLLADEGAVARFRFAALNDGWVSVTRPWHLLTTNTGAGNPHEATAEKGRRLMELLVDRLATFLVELSAADVDARFPFESR